MKVLQGNCQHTVKVTRFPNGYGIRVLVNGEISQEARDVPKEDISKEIQSMLRMEDKCGNISKMANRARFRHGEKLDKLGEWKRECQDAPPTTNKEE